MRLTTYGSVRTTATKLVLSGLLLSAAACNEKSGNPSAEPASGTASSNVAGVIGTRTTINGVETIAFDSLAFRHAPQWTIDNTPIMTAGGADTDPEYDLTYAYSAALLADGALATYSSIGTRLFLFAANGKPERVIGRHGKGPGEFMRAQMSLGLSDTLIVLDEANNRLNKVLRDGTFASTRALAKPAPFSTRMVSTLPDGRLVLSEAGIFPKSSTVLNTETPGAQRDTSLSPPAAIYILRADSGHFQIALVSDLQMARVETRYRGAVQNSPRPLRFTSVALAVAWDSSIVTSPGQQYAFDVRNTNGEVLSQVTVQTPRRAVNGAMKDKQIAIELARLNSWRGEGGEGMVDVNESRRLAREAPFADSLPAIQYLFTSPDRTLWVVDGTSAGDTIWTATAYKRDGSIARRLTVPSKGIPMTIGIDRLVMRVEDADGIASMRVYRLVPKS